MESHDERQLDISTDSEEGGTRTYSVCAILLLATHAGLLAWGSLVHSPTVDEVGHLSAGVSHWQLARFDLYRVNPPLVRMVAALPVLAMRPITNWQGYSEDTAQRPEFLIGQNFVVNNGYRSFFIFSVARWACIPFSIIGGLTCMFWARDLYGAKSGLLALTLWCFSPNILAHAQLITPDIGATSLGLVAAYTFWRWVRKPTWLAALVAGVALGLAEFTKLTWVILYALWPALWLVSLIWASDIGSRARALSQAAQLAIILILGTYVVNAGYGFEGSLTPLREYSFRSRALTDGHGEQSTTARIDNRFRDTVFAHLPVPFPRNFVLGIDVQKSQFENLWRPSYLRGLFRERGWWYYYIYALCVKVPLGTLLLCLVALAVRTVGVKRPLTSFDEAVLLIPALTIMILVSSQTGFNRHLRYVLPIFPFMFIWFSAVASNQVVKPQLLRAIAVSCIAWSTIASLAVSPHWLSYFNEVAGGPENGHAHLLNSNIDWGQDLLYLKKWLELNADSQPLFLAYYGEVDPHVAGIHYHLPPVARPDAKAGDEVKLKAGWYAISVNLMRGYPFDIHDGQGNRVVSPPHAYSYFLGKRAFSRAGYSIYIFHVADPSGLPPEPPSL